MNPFCEVCEHKSIPWFMKDKFNRVVQETFLECPLEDKNVAGCLISRMRIDWIKFAKYLIEHQAITEAEVKRLENSGWELRDGG